MDAMGLPHTHHAWRWHDSAEPWARLVADGDRLLQALAPDCVQAESGVLFEFEQLSQRLDKLRHRNFSGKPLVRIP